MPSSLKENKMGVMPVHRLLLSMALPMMISMLVQAMYNIVDSVFVAQLSQDALTAVTLAFPIQNLMIAVGSGTGVGINALLSRSLGEKNHDEASRAATNGVFLSAMSYLLFLLFGIFGAGAFISTLADNETVAAYATDYLSLCCMLSFGIFGQFVFERLLQSTGKTMLSMITQSVGAIINIILDPLFIFGLCGFPRLEVAGAAVATVFGQIVAMTLAIIFNMTRNKEIRLSFKGFRPNRRTIGRIYAVGLPSIFMMSIASIMNHCLNMILISLHSAGVAVFGAYFRLQSFIFMPVFGLNNGMVPIIAYNYGAKNRSRITKTIRLSVLYAVGLMLLGWVLFQTVPHVFLSFFNLEADTLPVAIAALRTLSYSFLFAGFCIVIVSVFQALSHGVVSLIVSVIRQLGVLIPAAYLLSLSGNIDLVWWAFPIAEIASLAVCVWFLARIFPTEIASLSDTMKAYVQQKIGWAAEYLRVMSKWTAVALITGILGGAVGALFHFSVDAANTVFNAYTWLIWLLPVGGLAIVGLYAAADMLKSTGTDEVIDSIRSGHHLRFVMAPLIFIATAITHLLGGSAGREGAALQLGGSIGVRAGRWLRFDQNERRVATLCGMSALFSALFCTPLTAAFFALEVISVGVMYYAALLPCLCSALIAFALARLFGAEPVAFDIVMPSASFDLLWRTAILAVFCAAVSIALCLGMRESHRLFAKAFKNPYWRIAVGGVAVIMLTFISGTNDYNGSGMHIVKQAVEQGVAAPTAWMWKLLFTAVTIGCGFKGGEIVPTLFIGSTFGCVTGSLLGLDPGVGAAIGLIAVFCGATNCPVASLILSIELFGAAALLPFALACAVCYVLSGNFGLYHAQIIMYSKLRPEYIHRAAK